MVVGAGEGKREAVAMGVEASVVAVTVGEEMEVAVRVEAAREAAAMAVEASVEVTMEEV